MGVAGKEVEGVLLSCLNSLDRKSVFLKILFIFREKGREGKEAERNIDAREKH